MKFNEFCEKLGGELRVFPTISKCIVEIDRYTCIEAGGTPLESRKCEFTSDMTNQQMIDAYAKLFAEKLISFGLGPREVREYKEFIELKQLASEALDHVEQFKPPKEAEELFYYIKKGLRSCRDAENLDELYDLDVCPFGERELYALTKFDEVELVYKGDLEKYPSDYKVCYRFSGKDLDYSTDICIKKHGKIEIVG